MKGRSIILWVLAATLAFYAFAFGVVFYAGIGSSAVTTISSASSSLLFVPSLITEQSGVCYDDPIPAATRYVIGISTNLIDSISPSNASSFVASVHPNVLVPAYENIFHPSAASPQDVDGYGSMSDVGILAAKRGEKIGSICGMPPALCGCTSIDVASPLHPRSQEIQVWVRINGNTHLLTINRCMRIREVREMIADREKCAAKDVYLVCNGTTLSKNYKFVADYPIFEQSNIFGFMRVLGGQKQQRKSSGPSSPSRKANKRSKPSATDSASEKPDSNAAGKGIDIMRTANAASLAAKIIRQEIANIKSKGAARKSVKALEDTAKYLDASAYVITSSINGVSEFKRVNRAYTLVRDYKEQELQDMGIDVGGGDPLTRLRNLFLNEKISPKKRGNTASDGDDAEPRSTLNVRRRSPRPYYVNGHPIPRPHNGTKYTPTETVDILDAANAIGQQNKRGVTEQCKAVKTWLLKSGLIGVKSVPALNALFRLYRDGQGEPPSKWSDNGIHRISDLKVLISLVEEDMKHRRAKTWGRATVRAALAKMQEKKLVTKGKDPNSGKVEVHQDTLEKYYSALCSIESFRLTRAARPKPRTREAAETSLRSAMSHLLTVAASSLIVGEPPAGRSIPKDASKGVDILIDLIRRSIAEGSDVDPIDLTNESDDGDNEDEPEDGDAPSGREDNTEGSDDADAPSSTSGGDGADAIDNSIDLYAIIRDMLFSTDDTTVFYFTGKGDDGKDEWRIGSKNEDGKTYSFHRESDSSSDRFNGISVRLTVTMGAGGTMAPVCATVTGLTDREIPREIESGRVIIPVKGLCVGGGVNPYADQVGYIVLLRNDAGIETRNFEWYSDNIRVPFVEKIREEVFDVTDSSQLTKEMTAALWSDGGIPQLTANVDERRLELNEARRIIECKHAAAASAAQQPCDLSPVFRVLKALARSWSVQPNKQSPVRKSLASELRKLEKNSDHPVKLADAKKNSLLDFAAILPSILAKAATQSNIVQGFVEAGMIDEETETTPDFYGLLNTMKRYRELWETDLVIKSFPRLYRYQINHGHVPDWLYDEEGYPVDTDAKGEEMEKSAGITQEWCQRAKCLSHPYQRKLRLAEIQEATRKLYDKREKERIGRESVLKLNREAEKKLHVLAERLETSGRRHLAQTPLAHLVQLKREELRAMLHARSCDTFHTRGKLKFPKGNYKGTLEDVNRAIENAELEMDLSHPEDCLLYRVSQVIGHTELKLKEMQYKSRESLTPDSRSSHTAPPLVAFPEACAGSNQPLPSSFLSNNDWLRNVQDSFKGVSFADDVTEDMKSKADAMLPLVRSRVTAQKKDRLRGNHADKHDHWSLLWAEENLSRLCAISVLAGHVADVSCAKSDSCLLRRPGRAEYQKALDPDNETLAGCYLYFDEEKGWFIRSGKVYGSSRGYASRNKDHVDGSMQRDVLTLDSVFYSRYPSKDADPEAISDRLREGYFEDLTMYCGLGFTKASAKHLCSTDGVLFWNDDIVEKVKKVNFSCNALKDKQLHMVGYLCELFYDVMISPNVNVSQSFGFETPLNIFGRDDRDD